MPEQPRTQDIGVTKFKLMTLRDFHELDLTLIVRDWNNGDYLAAVIPYKDYLVMQGIIIKTNEELERFCEEVSELVENPAQGRL